MDAVIAQYGIPGAMAIAFWVALTKEVIVMGREKRAAEKRADDEAAEKRYWRELALSGTELAKTSLSLQAEQSRTP